MDDAFLTTTKKITLAKDFGGYRAPLSNDFFFLFKQVIILIGSYNYIHSIAMMKLHRKYFNVIIASNIFIVINII